MNTNTNCRGYHHGPADAMLDWVGRGCERLMTAGGGPLIQDRVINHTGMHSLSERQRQTALHMASTGKYTISQIRKEIGATYAATRSLVRRAGMVARKERDERAA